MQGRLKISFQTTFDHRNHKSLANQAVAIHFRTNKKPEGQSGYNPICSSPTIEILALKSSLISKSRLKAGKMVYRHPGLNFQTTFSLHKPIN